jgi:hypothetical protein
MSSTSSRSLVRAPARRLVVNTSLTAMSRDSSRRPSGWVKSIATERLPRFAAWNGTSTPCQTLCSPAVVKPR